MAVRRHQVAVLAAVASTILGCLTFHAVGRVDAAARIKITKIFFDAPGPDTNPTNSSLNAEFVAVKNMTTLPVLMTGWKLNDAQSHSFTFPTGFTLAAGKTVRVHTGKGLNSSSDLYARSGSFIWNNTGDTATVRNSFGSIASTCKYPNTSGGVVIYGTDLTGHYATCP